jgi:nicotinate-nucleotide adenylyltransferase
MSRIGLLGGSFNPAHRGHRKASRHALAALGLDEIWWMVSPGNPLKPAAGMAPLAARMASARAMARRMPVRVTAIEAELGTRYTIDTLRILARRYRAHRFVWLMGADNLAQFHRWKDWRKIAALVPIAVVARPGYDRRAHSVRAMGWLRRYVRPAAEARNWTRWRLPAIVLLKLPPDPTSATAIRASRPDWHQSREKVFNKGAFNQGAHRDGVTRRSLHARRHFGRTSTRSADSRSS